MGTGDAVWGWLKVYPEDEKENTVFLAWPKSDFGPLLLAQKLHSSQFRLINA